MAISFFELLTWSHPHLQKRCLSCWLICYFWKVLCNLARLYLFQKVVPNSLHTSNSFLIASHQVCLHSISRKRIEIVSAIRFTLLLKHPRKRRNNRDVNFTPTREMNQGAQLFSYWMGSFHSSKMAQLHFINLPWAKSACKCRVSL